MDRTKVNVSDLIATLQANRDAHEKEFKAAKKDWLRQAKRALRKAADAAEKKGDINFYPLGKLPKPQHYLKSYDTMLARLEWEVEDQVELTEREFQSYVLDNWEWKDQFAGTTSLYTNH